MNARTLFAVFLAVLLAGCTHLGPQTVTRDRFDYNTAISDSWKQQTLLNIVKIRYADMPLFVEVASIVSGYTLEGSVNLAGTLSSGDSCRVIFCRWAAVASTPTARRLPMRRSPAVISTPVS